MGVEILFGGQRRKPPHNESHVSDTVNTAQSHLGRKLCGQPWATRDKLALM